MPIFISFQTPIMTTDPKPQGPASYFPSIEKKYGHPMDHWFDVVETHKSKKHMEIVSMLKSEHSMGHGHANAIVGYCLAQKVK